jgi:HK97 family phage major capsid protein/HK97 family phage prohead protease
MTDTIEPITGPPTRLPVPVCRTQSQLGEVRAETTEAGGSVRVMEGHFSVFDNWYEINSAFEGRFLERISPGAYKKTFKDDASRKNAGDKIKCLLEHGHDPQVADKPLGVPRALAEDENGARYEVPLLDTSYVRDLVPALEAGAYGSSFRFRVLQDEWVEEPERSDWNPDGIPERTIKEVRVMEFGPTMFPANGAATAGLRSTTDAYYEGLKRRAPEAYADALRSVRETRESLVSAAGGNESGRSESTPDDTPTDELLTARSEVVTDLIEAGYDADQVESLMPPVSMPIEDVQARAATLAALVDTGYEPDKIVEWVKRQDPSKPLVGVPYADPDKSTITPPGAGPTVTAVPAAKPAVRTIPAAKPAGDTGTPAVAPAVPRSRASTPTPPKEKAVTRSAHMDELTMTVPEREQRQAEIRTRLQEIDAEYNGAELPEERQTEWDSISAEYEVHTHAIRAATARAQRLAALAGNGDNVEGGTPFTPPNVIVKRPENVYDITSLRREARSVDDLARLMRDNAMRAVELNHYDAAPDQDEDDTRAHIERLLRRVDTPDGDLARRILQTGSDLYDRAFGKAALAGNVNGLNNEERAALAVGATATGGFAVPFSLDPTVIMTNASVVNPIRQVARVIQIAGKTWQGVTSAGITVSRAAEAAEASDNSPTLAQPTVTPTRVQGFVPFSFEVDQDWAQMRSELGMMFQEAKDVEEATSFTNGTGVDPQPEGFVTGIAAVGGSVIGTGGATFVAADVYKPADALPPRHTANAVWMGNKSVYSQIRQLDSNGGSALWARIGEGRPDQLLGYPVYEASAMPAFSTAGTTRLLVLGDFKKFLIVDKIGMSVELIPHLFGTANNFPTGQRGLYAVWRNSSKVLDANAFRLLRAGA